MTKPNDPQAWVLRSRALLQQSADALDGATRSRLTRARHAALEALPARASAAGWLRGFGLGATALGLALLAWRLLDPMLSPAASDSALANAGSAVSAMVEDDLAPPVVLDEVDAAVAEPDFELLVDAESYPLLEDLEFYAWLDDSEAQDG